tara:strand:+ start:28031 stop:28984 length:954 start_codon:yes stop_codon:yes gene_type:complete
MIFDLFRIPGIRFGDESASPLSPAAPTATVALGGGGARGLAHLGVMEAIGGSEVQTERIVGVSIGSLVGAMCAADRDIHRVQATANELLYSPIFQHKHRQLFGESLSESDDAGGLFSWYGRIKNVMSAHRRLRRAVTGPALMPDTLLREAIERLIPDTDIADLQTPLSIVAVDLYNGHPIVLETGSLRQAVLASSAVPGIFPPVPWEDKLLCDIGVLDSLPVDVANAYGNDLTIAVDVGQEHSSIHECNTALDVMLRMDDIGERLLRRRVLAGADVLIRPDVGAVAWCDFSDPQRLIDAGRAAGFTAMEPYQTTHAA